MKTMKEIESQYTTNPGNLIDTNVALNVVQNNGIIELLVDIRDLLIPKHTPTFPETTGTPLQTNKESK